MRDDELLERWKAERREPDGVPDGFAEGVMAEVRQRQRQHLAARTVALAWLGSRWGKVALCSVAFAAYVYRLAQVVAVLVVH